MRAFLTFLVFVFFANPLFADIEVLMFAGSTRAESYNKQLALDAAKIAKGLGAHVTLIDLKDFSMPFYDADLEKEQGMPENAKRLRALMLKSDAILIASPEYNQSISAVLKNTLDWVSRSEDGKTSHDFEGKRFGIMSASPGKKGGARGLIHLRAIIKDIGGDVIDREVCIPKAHLYFADEKRPENPSLVQALRELIRS